MNILLISSIMFPLKKYGGFPVVRFWGAPLGGTGEDALLDLERAREESGVLRWALLRQILADMRARMAEMSSNISD